MYFAVEDLKPIDPEITAAFAWVMAILAVAFIGMIIVYSARLFIGYRKRKNQKLREAKDAIWFDHVESELHCELNKMRIEPKSFEYFVCKLILKAPSQHTTDLDIFDEAERAKGIQETNRGVEQAVRRLNKKAKTLGLKDDLFKRSKERTSVNDEYRERIVKN